MISPDFLMKLITCVVTDDMLMPCTSITVISRGTGCRSTPGSLVSYGKGVIVMAPGGLFRTASSSAAGLHSWPSTSSLRMLKCHTSSSIVMPVFSRPFGLPRPSTSYTTPQPSSE